MHSRTGLALLLSILTSTAVAQPVDPAMHHLCWGDIREWDDFPEKPAAAELSATFHSTANAAERTLRLRHRDLRQAWEVHLNGKKLATLPRDEPETVTYYAVPAGAMVTGDNTVRVFCAARPPATQPATSPVARAMAALSPASDDVMIGDIAIVDSPRAAALSEATIAIRVTGDDGKPLPCRITIIDDRGALIDLGNTSDRQAAVRPGVVYAGAGTADIRLPAGRYTVTAGRGFEYSLAPATVEVRAGERVAKELQIRRVVATPGWVACDPHVHTFTFSRHGDATIEERMFTLAGEGIELPIATDHNLNVDYAAPAAATGMAAYFTPITGNEVTTKIGHFNVFPLASKGALPDWRAPTWRKIGESIEAAKSGPRVVTILNHARDIHAGFRPFDPSRHLSPTGEDLDGWELPATAMEVVNSAATLTEPMLLFRDWFGLLNRGLQITPIGASDCHDVNRFIVGQARTYIRTNDADPAKINVVDAVNALRDGRVLVSYGLLAEMTVNDRYGPGDVVPAIADGGELKVRITVQGPEWTSCRKVTLYANGVAIRSADVAADTGAKPGVKFSAEWTLSRPRHDVWLAVIADGPGVTGPHWPASRPYQKTASAWTPYVIGATGAVRIDADGSDAFDSALAYATRIAEQSADRQVDRLNAIAATDPAAARSVASQWCGVLRHKAGGEWMSRIESARKQAKPEVLKGFDDFVAAWKHAVLLPPRDEP